MGRPKVANQSVGIAKLSKGVACKPFFASFSFSWARVLMTARLSALVFTLPRCLFTFTLLLTGKSQWGLTSFWDPYLNYICKGVVCKHLEFQELGFELTFMGHYSTLHSGQICSRKSLSKKAGRLRAESWGGPIFRWQTNKDPLGGGQKKPPEMDRGNSERDLEASSREEHCI